MSRIWVVGPIAWDWVYWIECFPKSGGFAAAKSREERPGGTGANVAVGLGSAQLAVSMVGYVGSDEIGKRMLTHLAQATVDTKHVLRLPGSTSHVLLLVDVSGERTIIGVGPDRLSDVLVPVDVIKCGEIVYFAAWHESFRTPMEALRDQGVTVVSVPGPELALTPADIIVGSESQFARHDLTSLSAVSQWSSHASAVVVTRGAQGATLHLPGHRQSFPTQAVQIKDTTGAGDAFVAGLICELVKGKALPSGIHVGSLWAAATIALESSSPPSYNELFAERAG